MRTTPLLAPSREELADALAGARREGHRVALVPTMGALHTGHAGLVRRAREEVGPEGRVVVSIFVNPLQFGPGEDLERYPRTLAADLDLCAREGVDVAFAPSVEEVYPGGEPQVVVDPGPPAAVLEGASRPTHFRGVLTVVAKLLGLARPDVACFGEKDYQQLALVRRMVADLCLGTEVVGVQTVREDDGLALSSRNRYLTLEERVQAVALSRGLYAAQLAAQGGAGAALAAAREQIDEAALLDPDYLEMTAPDLGPAPEEGEARILVAARIGKTRLIDNMPLTLSLPLPPATDTSEDQHDLEGAR